MRIVFPANKQRFMFAAVFCFGLLLLGVFIAIFPEDFSAIPDPTVIGGTIAVIFGGLLFWVFIKLTGTKEGLILDEQGITDNVGGIQVGLVKWTDIEKFGETTQVGNKFIIVYLKDPVLFLEQFKGMKKKIVSDQFSNLGSPVTISTNMLKGSYTEIKAAVEAEGAKHGINFE